MNSNPLVSIGSNTPAAADASPITRRNFIKATSTAAAALSFPNVLRAASAGGDPIRVALVGCGGRGSGAGKNVVAAAENVQIVALADIFPEQIAKAQRAFPEVPQENCFSGFDAYQKAIAVPGVNYVILATPPGFRPAHFEAAVAAGKHVFMEKPIAVDAVGVRSVLAAGERAKQKGLSVGAGTQRRHDAQYIESISRIQGGAIGELVTLRAYWNGGGIWHRGDVGETEMERQIRNWYHYVWLCGDHIVEQHVHNLDVCNWIMADHPVRCWGMGGRECRTGSGHIYDHFTVEYEYENGVRMFSFCRQMPGEGNVSEAVHGTHGSAKPGDWIKPAQGEGWRAPRGGRRDPYVQEHTNLIAAIRSGKPLNEAQNVAESTLTAIMGREAAYSGKIITWDEALNWKRSLVPEKLAWGPAPEAIVPRPGVYRMA